MRHAVACWSYQRKTSGIQLWCKSLLRTLAAGLSHQRPPQQNTRDTITSQEPKENNNAHDPTAPSRINTARLLRRLQSLPCPTVHSEKITRDNSIQIANGPPLGSLPQTDCQKYGLNFHSIAFRFVSIVSACFRRHAPFRCC